jgi:hypothetical protein
MPRIVVGDCCNDYCGDCGGRKNRSGAEADEAFAPGTIAGKV